METSFESFIDTMDSCEDPEVAIDGTEMWYCPGRADADIFDEEEMEHWVSSRQLLVDAGIFENIPKDYAFPSVHHLEGFFGRVIRNLFMDAIFRAEARIQNLDSLESGDIVMILLDTFTMSPELAKFIADGYRVYSQDLFALFTAQATKECLRVGSSCAGEEWKVKTYKKERFVNRTTSDGMDSFGFGFPSYRKDNVEFISVSTLAEANSVVGRVGAVSFHGTSLASAGTIHAMGIDLSKSRFVNELSVYQAFYTTDSLHLAIDTAKGKASSSTESLWAVAAVVLFLPVGRDISDLPHSVFEKGPAFQEYVYQCIHKKCKKISPGEKGSSWITSPMCKSTRVEDPSEVQSYARGLQTAFLTQEVAAMLGRYCAKVVLVLDNFEELRRPR